MLRKKVPYLILLFLLFSIWHGMIALIVGSNTAPSRQAIVTFPKIDTTNTMRGFAAFENGFRLQSNTTTCTYDNFFPISGPVDLRGGRLYLKKDVSVDQAFRLTSSGALFGASYSLELAKRVSDFSLSTSLRFDNITLVLNSDTNINAPLQFTGDCKINGRGLKLSLQNRGSLVVRPGATLILEDVDVVGLKSNNVQCLTDQSSMIWRNAIFKLSQNYTFSNGSILFDQGVVLTGTNTFAYGSGLTSTINSLTTLVIDHDMTFNYAPRLANRNLIFMTDQTSNFLLNSCTLFSTWTGLQLQTGTLIFDDNVTVSSAGRNSGESLVLNSNLTTKILSGANVQLFGQIRYG